MDRRAFVGAATGVLALPFAARAQQTVKVSRIGYLRHTSAEPADIEALRLGLRELGYVEGQNLIIDERYANGDAARLPDLVRELIALKVQVLVVDGGTTVRAVRDVVGATPVVTGAARSLGIDLIRVNAQSPGELAEAFAKMSQAGVTALLLENDAMFFSQRTRFADLAARQRLPAIYGEREFADAGGLMAYASSSIAIFRRAATCVDRVLKGAKPGDLPIEQPTRIELVINLKAAKALGNTIPQSVLLRADDLIQ